MACPGGFKLNLTGFLGTVLYFTSALGDTSRGFYLEPVIAGLVTYKNIVMARLNCAAWDLPKLPYDIFLAFISINVPARVIRSFRH